jgi:hypothetical protein
MKTITRTFVMWAVLFMSLMCVYQLRAQQSELILKTQNNQSFRAFIDNQPVVNTVNAQVISNLTPGRHHVRMISNPQYNGAAFVLPALLYDGYVDVPGNTRMTAMVINLGFIQIILQEPLFGGIFQPMGMHPADFEMLKQTIRNQSFDSSRLSVTKQASTMNYLTSRQVFELTELLTFESSKLEFAKHAYNRTVDRNNYYVVNNAFTFSSSVDELTRYIQNIR